MKQDTAWHLFETTGDVSAYLRYHDTVVEEKKKARGKADQAAAGTLSEAEASGGEGNPSEQKDGGRPSAQM